MHKQDVVLLTDNIGHFVKCIDGLVVIFTLQKTIPLGDIPLDFG
jgi:hypothetical protein